MLLLFSCPVMSDSLRPHGLQPARPFCPSPLPEVCPSSRPLHQGSHPAISSSDTLFSFCLQSFPASETFPMSQLFASDDQNIGVSASASVLPMSIQGLFPLALTGLISLLSKTLSGVFSRTTVRTHQFSDLHLLYDPALTTIHDHWEDYSFDYMDLCQQSNASAFQHTVWVCHSFPVKKQTSSEFTAAVTICKMRKCVTTSTSSPPACHEVTGMDAKILVFLAFTF